GLYRVIGVAQCLAGEEPKTEATNSQKTSNGINGGQVERSVLGGIRYTPIARLIPSTTVEALSLNRNVKRMRCATLYATFIATLSIAAVLVMPMVEAAPLKLQFQQTWGGPNSEIANGIAIGTDGNIYLAGQTNSFGAGGFDA